MEKRRLNLTTCADESSRLFVYFPIYRNPVDCSGDNVGADYLVCAYDVRACHIVVHA